MRTFSFTESRIWGDSIIFEEKVMYMPRKLYICQESHICAMKVNQSAICEGWRYFAFASVICIGLISTELEQFQQKSFVGISLSLLLSLFVPPSLDCCHNTWTFHQGSNAGNMGDINQSIKENQSIKIRNKRS